jgi:hypothetical protein
VTRIENSRHMLLIRLGWMTGRAALLAPPHRRK